MPVVNRKTLIDRPTLIDPILGNEEEEQFEEGESENKVSRIGEGGGKVVHNIEFEEGDRELVQASNMIAAISTGTAEPNDVFVDIFSNAALQLKEADSSILEQMASASEDLGTHNIGVVWEEESEPDTEEVEDSEEEDVEEDEEEQVEETEE